MSRHPFDPIALVLGAAVCLAGIVAVADADPDVGSLPRWLVPVAIIAVGTVMVLGAVLRTNRAPATATAPSASIEAPEPPEPPGPPFDEI